MFLQLRRAYLDDLKVHDLDDPAAVYSLRSARRTLTPRRVQENRTSRHGIVDRTRFYGEQVIDLAGYSWGPTDVAAQDAHDELAARLALPGPRTFRFLRLGRSEEEQVVVTLGAGPDAPAEGYARTIRWTCSLVGADPRVYSAVLRSGIYDPTGSLSGGGFAMPMAFPLVFSATTATELIVSNGGQFPTPPVLTVKGPVGNPIIDNDTTVESIYLLAQLGTADTVVIDVAARSVKLNGAERKDLFDASRSTWFELPRGEVALRLRGTNMAAGVTSLGVSYRDARI